MPLPQNWEKRQACCASQGFWLGEMTKASLAKELAESELQCWETDSEACRIAQAQHEFAARRSLAEFKEFMRLFREDTGL